MRIDDPLLNAARELKLRCFVGRLPFDADAWLAKSHECDLPASPTQEMRPFAPTDGDMRSEGTGLFEPERQEATR